MKLFLFDQKKLKYDVVSPHKLGILSLFLIFLGVFFGYIVSFSIPNPLYLERTIKILNEREKFSEESLKEYILELNIKFPDVVLAQSRLESGGYKSQLFRTNNNLFGMKKATSRPSTNKGVENGYAYYDNWKQSVVDYALYQAAYLSDIKSRDEYLQYLQQRYAEDSSYVTKLKKSLK